MKIKGLLISLIWFPSGFMLMMFIIGIYFINPELYSKKQNLDNKLITLHQTPYNFYSSLPNILGAKSVNNYYIQSQDVIPELIHDYLEKYKSPMLGSYKHLISSARKNEIDPLLLISIAQCESNLGKKMPHKGTDPLECHNPFGWGIHSAGTLCFDTWQESYDAISKGLREKYFNQGMNNPEDIMGVYTPPALENGGSWAKCVNQFMNTLNEMKSEIK